MNARSPDLTGVARAWRINLKPSRREQEATVEAWLVHGPFHPLWSWWMVSAVSLRDIPGAPPAARHFPDATHEILIVSIDPETPPEIDRIEAGEHYLRFLTPVDFVGQYVATDDEVREVVRLMVRTICAGEASPDQDWRSWWQASVPNTLEHLRRPGAHGERVARA